MTKADLIAGIAKEAKISNRLTLPGFGTFSVAKRKARTGRNPRTGGAIKISARKVAKFKPGNLLRKAVK
jgi:DNA-binding protein HU-beta